MAPLQLNGHSTSISNLNRPEEQSQVVKNRCVGSPINYCFAYYFSQSFRHRCQTEPSFLNGFSSNGYPSKGKHFSQQHSAQDDSQIPLVAFNEGLDPPLEALIDVIYSQQRDGEICIEYEPNSGRLAFLTFIDISTLYNDKQLFAF